MKITSLTFFLLVGVILGQAPIRPDARLTPGATFSGLTVEQLVTRKTSTVRDVPDSEKNAVFAEYHIDPKSDHFEVDHLISLELGGSNDIHNLWPQSYTTSPYNAHVKDRLEDWMAASIRHTLTNYGHDQATRLLTTYQHEIATDWIAAYTKYLGGQSAHR